MAKPPIKPKPPKGNDGKLGSKITTRRQSATTAKKSTSNAGPLIPSPSSKGARVRIAEYVQAVENEHRSFNVMFRGKHIAVLGPVESLPKTQTIQKTVNVSDIATGKSTFSSVIHLGAYSVMRHSKQVAVIYSPQATESSKTENLLRKTENMLQMLDDLEVIKLAKERMSQVRQKAEGMAKSRIDYLRRTNQAAEANKLQNEFDNIIAGDKDL